MIFGLGQQLDTVALERGNDLCPEGRPFRDRVRRLYWGCTKTDTWLQKAIILSFVMAALRMFV